MIEYMLYFSTDNLTSISGWKELIFQKGKQADYIMIDCFDEDQETMDILKSLNGYELKEIGHMTLFRFESNNYNIQDLIMDRLIDNKLCWFSVFLMKEDKCLFSFEHHATEFTVNELTALEMDKIISAMPDDANCIPHEINI